MKIIDHVGNSIVKGRLMRWQPSEQHPDFYVRVADIVEPTAMEPGKVVIVLTMGIAPQVKKEGAIQFKDFVTVFDPEDELKTEVAMSCGLSMVKGGK